MKLIVEDRAEAIEIAGTIVEMCNVIRGSNIPDTLQTSYEVYLCRIRDSIEIKKETE